VVTAILHTLLEGLLLYAPLSLRSTPSLDHTLETIRQFGVDVLTTIDDEEIKGLAMSLQLTMGLLVGSVTTLIQTVEMIAEHKLIINEKVLKMIEYCIDIPADFDISFPNIKVRCTSIATQIACFSKKFWTVLESSRQIFLFNGDFRQTKTL
jgi:hypothetical protein